MTNEDQTVPAPASAPAMRRRPPIGGLRWIVIALAAVVLVYLVSPYYSFWRFTQALKAGDQQRFERMVDFRSVRESLKKQLRAKLAEGRPEEPKKEKSLLGLSDQFGPRLIDTLVDAYVTPAGLAGLLADVKVVNADGSSADAAAAPRPDAGSVVQSEAVHEKLGWSSVRYAFFTGARDFLIDVDGTKLRFRFSKAKWLLKTVEPELGEIRL